MKFLRYFFLVALCVSCIDPYIPPFSLEKASFIVVDGYISIDGTAYVKLSRSIPLSSDVAFPRERDATVTIKSTSGETFSLTEVDSIYIASNLNVSADERYTLNIKTTDGGEYVSDEVQVYSTPPIDDIMFSFPEKRDLLEIRVSAKDPNPNSTGFYLWDMIETYEYHAPIYAGFKIDGDRIIEREPEEILYFCYRDVVKPSVMLSTKSLSENVISKFAVARVEKGSEKLSARYSILVKQRAISEAEFAFRTQVQKTSEQQGGIFAVMPGTVVGNVRSQNPDEFVLGYFRAQELKEKRFFIEFEDLPKDFQIPQEGVPTCAPIKTCDIPLPPQYFDCTPLDNLSDDVLIVTSNTDGRGVITSYNYVVTACGDCTYRGGKTTPPPFW